MRVAGEVAREWTVIRLDTMEQVNGGPLTMADSTSGIVEWIDRTGNTRTVSLGPHTIRIIRKSPYGR